MNRTSAGRRLAAFAGLGVTQLLVSCGPREERSALVVVTIDTCRADRIGCYGATTLDTPAIDGVAKDGVAFLQATAPTPLTLPSHCTMFTGLDPDRHGVRDNGAERLSQDARTLAEILREGGWKTGAFVSAYPLVREFGLDQGFDTFDDTLDANASGRDRSQAGAGRGKTKGPADVASRLYYDERRAKSVTDAALAWIRERSKEREPFFAWVHYFDPHAEYRAPEPFASRHRESPYDGEIAYVDSELARILTEVRTVRKDATIAILADHGESLGEHGERTHGLFVYESTLRVPWVMSGPRVPRGSRVEDPVALANVTPTLLDALGLVPPEGGDGTSLLPVARGEPAAPLVFAESLFPLRHFGWASLHTVRRGNWKLVDAPRSELFDLSADPNEMRDLAPTHPEIVRELQDAIRVRGERGGKLTSPSRANDDEARARLEALGYVGGHGTRSGGDEPQDETGGRAANVGRADPKDRVDLFNRYQEVATLIVDRRDAEAERILREILAQDPENLEVLGQLALLRRLQEDWPEAKRLCEEILRLDPEDSSTRKNLAFVHLRMGDRARARALYEEVTRLDPGDADALGLWGGLLTEDGRPREAIEVLARATQLAPHDAELVVLLGRARDDAGDASGALADYDRALAIDPGATSAVIQRGILLRKLGRVDEAVRTLRAGLERNPEDPEILNNLAFTLADESIDVAQALELARRAAALAPDDPAVLDTLGWAAVRAGSALQGVAPLRRALDATGDPTVRAHLGIALAATGEEREGREQIRRAAKDDPRVLEIPEARALH